MREREREIYIYIDVYKNVRRKRGQLSMMNISTETPEIHERDAGKTTHPAARQPKSPPARTSTEGHTGP